MLIFERRAKIAAIAVVIAGVIAVALFQFSRAKCFQLFGDVVCQVETDAKLVALTIDDGPTPDGANAIMAALAAHDAKATFFLVGRAVERNPDVVRGLIAAGHEIGNHSYSHVRNIGRSRAFYAREVGRTNDAIRALGAEPTLFRPPYGLRLIGLPLEVEKAGLGTIMWDVAEGDSSTSSAEVYAANILRDVRPGSIVLIHAMYRHHDNARAALPLILKGLNERGYRVVTVSHLLKQTRNRQTADNRAEH